MAADAGGLRDELTTQLQILCSVPARRRRRIARKEEGGRGGGQERADIWIGCCGLALVGSGTAAKLKIHHKDTIA